MSSPWTPKSWDRYWLHWAEHYEAKAREARAQIGKMSPQHVCGLQGFGQAGDHCEACAVRSSSTTGAPK